MANLDSFTPTTPLHPKSLRRLGLLGPLVHFDVVHQHFGGEFGRCIGIAWQTSTEGQVEHKVEALVEGGGERSFVGRPFLLGLPGLSIDAPSDLSFFPKN